MIFGDAGSSWCKIFDVEDGAVRIVSTRELVAEDIRFDWGTGHTARNRSEHFENDLFALTRGALALVDQDDFTVLDLGSRDAKLVGFKGRRPVKLDWSVGCAAATGATVEMIGRFYEVDFNTLPIDDAWTAVTCGTYAVEKVMDAVSSGESAEAAIGRFVHGLARNAFNFTGKPKSLYLSGGFTGNRAFLAALGRYTEVLTMGRTMPLAGLWAFAAETDTALGSIPAAITAGTG
jgi:activator of 2-hydroxyglutaryl-CoA dehydratase